MNKKHSNTTCNEKDIYALLQDIDAKLDLILKVFQTTSLSRWLDSSEMPK